MSELKSTNLNDTMDAVVWAAECKRINPILDEDFLRTWFANAIMAGYDIGRRELRAENERLRDALEQISVGSPIEDAMRAEAAERENERLIADNDRLRRDRYDALSVTSKDGLLASEWVARTGKAERERDETKQALSEAEDAIKKAVPSVGVGGRSLFGGVHHPWFDLPAVKRALGEGK